MLRGQLRLDCPSELRRASLVRCQDAVMFGNKQRDEHNRGLKVERFPLLSSSNASFQKFTFPLLVLPRISPDTQQT